MFENKNLIIENKQSYSIILGVFMASRFLFYLLMLVSETPLNQILYLFDGEHYNTIAQYGYCSDFLTAFFPFVPLLIRYTGHIGTLMINAIANLLSAFVLYLLLDKCDAHKRMLIVCIFLMSPISLFSTIEYTEALFFFFTIFSFYLFREQKWWTLGFFLGFSVLTRNTGSMLFFSIFICMTLLWAKKQIKIWNIFQTFIPATMISLLYPVYLQIKFDNWKMFVDVQYSEWAKVKTNIFSLFITQLKIIFTKIPWENTNPKVIFFWKMNEIISLIFIILIILLVVNYWRKNKIWDNIKNIKTSTIDECFAMDLVAILYVFFCVVAINSTSRIPERTSPTISYYRYYIAMFPLFLWLSSLSDKRVLRILLYMFVFTIFSGILFFQNVFFF